MSETTTAETRDVDLDEPASPAEPRRPWWARLNAGWCLFGAVTVFAVALYWPAWRAPRQVWIGEDTDSAQFIWFAEWLRYALLHGHGSLLTSHVNYPIGINLMWQPTPVLPNFLVLPVTVLGGPVLAYNVLCTLAMPAAAAGGYLACRRLVDQPWAAAAGGLAYGISPFLITHMIGHVFLEMTFLVALAFVVLHELFVRQRWPFWRTGVALGVLGAATLLTAEEFLAYDAVLGTLGLALLGLLARRQVAGKLPYAWRAALVGVAVLLPLAAYPLWVQFRGPNRLSVNGLHPAILGGNDLLNLVVPTNQLGARSATGTIAHFVGWHSEWSGYIGVPMLLLIGIVVALGWRRTRVRFAALLALLITVLALGVRLHVHGHAYTGVPLPWAAVDHVPLLADAIAARSMAYGDLAIALLVGFFAAELPRIARRSRAVGVTAMVLLAAALASWIPVTASTTTLPQPAYFTGPADPAIPAGAPVLVLPYTVNFPRRNESMLWQAVAGMRFTMPAGYFLMSDPQGRTRFVPALTPLTYEFTLIQLGRKPGRNEHTRTVLLADLRKRQLAAVIVGPSPFADAERDYLTWLLGRPPAHAGGVDIWYHPASP